MVRARDFVPRGPRWRIAIGCLIACLLFVAAGVTPTFGKGWDSGLVSLSVEVLPNQPKYKVCAGQATELLVRGTAWAIGDTFPFIGVISPAPVVKITGTNSNIRAATLERKLPFKQDYGVDEPYAGERFDLKGLKPGIGTLTFRASMSLPRRKPATASAKVDYQVISCDYAVSEVHILSGGGRPWLVAMGDVRVVADQGGRLSGTGELDWAYAGSPGDFADCTIRTTIPASIIDITGEIADDGQLTLNVAYGPATFSHVVSACSNPHHLTGQTKVHLEPQPLSTVVSPEGGSIDAQRGSSSSIEETIVLTVEPIHEPAVARVGMDAARAPSGGLDQN